MGERRAKNFGVSSFDLIPFVPGIPREQCVFLNPTELMSASQIERMII
jgi:hypothetical protein